jgi:hypothetical protein
MALCGAIRQIALRQSNWGGTRMNTIIPKQGRAMDYLRFLGSVEHMAQTTRSEHARRAFKMFLKQERKRFEAGRRESGATE